MNGGEHVPNSYWRVIMPVLNTSVLVIVYIQGTEVLAWLQLTFVLTFEIRSSYLINKIRNMNEAVADILHTSYNDHEFHTCKLGVGYLCQYQERTTQIRIYSYAWFFKRDC